MNKFWSFDEVLGKLRQSDPLVQNWAVDYLIRYFPEISISVIVDLIESKSLKIDTKIESYLSQYGHRETERLIALLPTQGNYFWQLANALAHLKAVNLPAAIKENFINKTSPSLTTKELMYSFGVLGQLQSVESEWMLGGYYSSIKSNTHKPELIQTCAHEFMKVARPEHFSNALDEVYSSLNTKGVINILNSIIQFIDKDIYHRINNDLSGGLLKLMKDIGRTPRSTSDKDNLEALEKLIKDRADSSDIMAEAIAACAGFCADTSVDFGMLHDQWEQGILQPGAQLNIVKILNILTHLAGAEIKGTPKKVLSRYAVAAYLSLLAQGPTIYRFDYKKPKLKQTVDIIKRKDSFIPEIFINIAASFGSKIVPHLMVNITEKSKIPTRLRILRIISLLPIDCRVEIAKHYHEIINCLSIPALHAAAFDALCFISSQIKSPLKKILTQVDNPARAQAIRVLIYAAEVKDRDFIESLLGQGFDDEVISVLERLAQVDSLDALEELNTSNLPNRKKTSAIAKPTPVASEEQLDEGIEFIEQFDIMSHIDAYDMGHEAIMLLKPVIVDKSNIRKHALAVISRVNSLEALRALHAREWAHELETVRGYYSWTGKVYHPRMSMPKVRSLQTNGAQMLKAKQLSNRQRKKKKRQK